MRDFTDETGGRWDVTLGHESWGAFFALFVPKGAPGNRKNRRTMLDETSQIDAMRALMSLSETRLAELFRESKIEEIR